MILRFKGCWYGEWIQYASGCFIMIDFFIGRVRGATTTRMLYERLFFVRNYYYYQPGTFKYQVQYKPRSTSFLMKIFAGKSFRGTYDSLAFVPISKLKESASTLTVKGVQG